MEITARIIGWTLGVLGFWHLMDMRYSNPAVAWPIIYVLAISYILAVAIEIWKHRR